MKTKLILGMSIGIVSILAQGCGNTKQKLTGNSAQDSAADGSNLNGNGEGYSGPDTKGTSIPTTEDRLFQEEILVKATKTCLSKTTAAVYQNLFGRAIEPNAIIEIKSDPRCDDGHTVSSISSDTLVCKLTPGVSIINPNGCKVSVIVANNLLVDLDLEAASCLDLSDSISRKFSLSTSGGFAQIGYEKVPDPVTYDPYGNGHDPDTWTITKVDLGHQELPGLDLTVVPLWNTSQLTGGLGGVSRYTVNAKEYRSCLDAEIQH